MEPFAYANLADIEWLDLGALEIFDAPEPDPTPPTQLFEFELRFYHDRRPEHEAADRLLADAEAICREPVVQTLKERDGFQALFREPMWLGAPDWGTVAA